MRGQQQVYDYLEKLGINFDYYEHPEAPTIEIAAQYYRGEGTVLCKNLFFRNHKGNRHYLVIFQCDQHLAIHDLEQRLHQGKLSFASEQRMERYLGLRPGSVSPFGLLNDREHHVYVFLDEALKGYTHLSFHPNDNRASLNIKFEDFVRYMDATGNGYEWIRLYD